MKINGLDWMEWLHKIREEEYIHKKDLAPVERLKSIHQETQEIIKRLKSP